MAQTKRKRRPSKHRGNAAGKIEVRGRTGRKPTVAEQRADQKAAARAGRLEKPPTWKSAVTKAAIAAVAFAVLFTLLIGRELSQSIVLALFTFVMYIPLSYYVDAFVYKRAMARRAKRA